MTPSLPAALAVHKSLCKVDQSIFRQAPLTQQELADIDAFADETYNTSSAGPFLPYTVRQALTAASALEDWSASLTALFLLITRTGRNRAR